MDFELFIKKKNEVLFDIKEKVPIYKYLINTTLDGKIDDSMKMDVKEQRLMTEIQVKEQIINGLKKEIEILRETKSGLNKAEELIRQVKHLKEINNKYNQELEELRNKKGRKN